jgi:hypothetical protein
MKHTKLLFSISMVLFALGAKGQSFQDGTRFFSMLKYWHLGFEQCPISETLTVDSITDETVHYSVVREYWGDNERYPLVYGYAKFERKDTFQVIEVNNQVWALNLFAADTLDDIKILLCDFNLQAGDTFKTNFQSIEVEIVIDSVITTILKNAELDTVWHGHFISYNNFSKSELLDFLYSKKLGFGAGFSFLIDLLNNPYNEIYSPEIEGRIISVCNNDTLFYFKNFWYGDDKIPLEYQCNLDTLFENFPYDVKGSIDKNQNLNLISVYPNPTKDFLYLERKDKTLLHSIESTLMNSLGQSVFETTENQIPVGNLPNGIYFLHIKDTQNLTHETHKIIIQH